jgi:putative transposase
MQMLDWESDELTVQTQAELLGLNRSGLYYVSAQVSANELALKRRIDELYTQHPFYGSRKIAEELGINRKAAQRHMREMGLAAVYPKPNLSRQAAKAGIFPYLLRGLAITVPNQVFTIDITYIRMLRGWMYLVAVMDWYSRYVVSWEMDETLEMPFVLSAVDRALTVATPTIWNSDQGSHFTSPAYLSRLQTAHVAISMDGRGRVTDNIFIERLWRSVKYEEVYLNEYESPRQARQRLSAYLEFYNHRRKHQALNYLTPAQKYAGLNRTKGRLIVRLPN